MLSPQKTSPPQSTPWLNLYKPNPRAQLRLFCFPYAGGAAVIFRNWANHLPQGVEVCPVQLPGRGTRVGERPYSDMPRLIEALSESLAPHMDRPFAFFGHSLGALVSYELAHSLRTRHGLEPLHMFVSGRKAPHLPETEPPTYDLPEAEFIEELRRLNGTPAEVLAHPELIQMFVPLLRADFELCEAYRHVVRPPLDCPVTAFGGLFDEDVARNQLEPWREQTTAAFSLRMLPGDHFFLHSAELMLLQLLARDLHKLLGELDQKRLARTPVPAPRPAALGRAAE